MRAVGNSCRCSVGGETIRLSSQSSRVRYTAPLFFFLFFFFLLFFSIGGGILCIYVFFCLCNTPPGCNHHRRPPRCPNAKSTQCTHASSERSWAAGSSLHLLPSPAKLFQWRIRVKIRQVTALHSSLALSPTYTYLIHNTYVASYVCGRIMNCISCLLYTSPSPRDGLLSRMPSSA